MGTEVVVYDDEAPYHIMANLVASPLVTNKQDKNVTLLYDSKITPVMHEVENTFINRGYSVDFCSLSQKPSEKRDIIALLDLEKPFFGHIEPSTFESFKSFLVNLKSAGILWVTKSAHFGSENPLFALVFGMARTLRLELSIDFGTFEMDSMQSGVWDALQKVFDKFQRRDKDSDLDPEYEYAWIDGAISIGRFHWPLTVHPSIGGQEVGNAKRLQIGKHGLLGSLFWEDYQPATLLGSQVEIETRAVGMNFRVRMERSSLFNIG